MKKSLWTHDKYKVLKFEGVYLNARLGTGEMERSLVLVSWTKDGNVRFKITVGSWQNAKALGWVKE